MGAVLDIARKIVEAFTLNVNTLFETNLIPKTLKIYQRKRFRLTIKKMYCRYSIVMRRDEINGASLPVKFVFEPDVDASIREKLLHKEIPRRGTNCPDRI